MSWDDDKPTTIKHPFLAVTLAFLAIALLPLLLYPLAPADPLAVGHVVYAAGKERVTLLNAPRYERYGFDTTCILEARAQIIIMESPQTRNDHTLLARMHESADPIQFPYCPPRAELIVQVHQVKSKEGLLTVMRDAIRNIVRTIGGLERLSCSQWPKGKNTTSRFRRLTRGHSVDLQSS